MLRQAPGPEDPQTLTAQEDLATFINLALSNYEESMPLARATWEARARVLEAVRAALAGT